MIDPDDPNVRMAVFGKQVEDFLDTEIGDYLVRKAREESMTAIEELKAEDPHNWESIQKIQNRIKVAESIVGWLADAIIAGQQAMDNVRQDQE